jgi:hypothetical protein
MLAIFALAVFYSLPVFLSPDMWDAQLHATTHDVEDQHVNLAQKNVNGILLVFPGGCGKSIERLRTRSEERNPSL